MAEATDTYALAYQTPESKLWHYIPTVPEARKWRGPYLTWKALMGDLAAELGDDATVTVTQVAPRNLCS